jgi:choline-glycine betaine transporter
MNQTKKHLNVLRGTFLVTLILLVIQYVFGMIVNLYVQFPNLSNGNGWGWAVTHTFVVPIHIYLGTALLVVALIGLGISIWIRRVSEIVAATLGLAMILFAWISGAMFLANGQQSGVSLQMALGFIGAVLAYGVGCYIAHPASLNSKNTTQEARVRVHETSLTAR